MHYVTAAPSHENVVITQVAAAGALVGFVLVFVGILAGSYQTLLGRLPQDKLAPFRQAASLGLVVFAIGLAAIAAGTAWLLGGGGEALYVLTAVLFFLELGGLLVIAVVSWKVLLR